MKHPNEWMRWLTLTSKLNWRRNPNFKFLISFVAVIGIFSALKHFDQQSVKRTSWHGTKWQLAQTHSDRTPASGEECLPINPKVDELQKENEKLNHLKRHSIRGHWLHLNLAKLTFPEARFLSHFPEAHFISVSEQLKLCNNIPCLYNQLSQDLTGEYGELAWNFFLKSGIALQWKDPNNSFNKNELHLLWQLASQLPSLFKHQAKLQILSKSPLRQGVCFNTNNATVEISTDCLKDDLSNIEIKKIIVAGMAYALHSQLSPTEQASYSWHNNTWNKEQQDRVSFSEQVAQYIVQYEAAPGLQDYFKNNLFKRDWSLAGEMHRMFKKDQWLWRDIKNRHLNDCLDLHKSALIEKKSSRGIASLSEPHPLAACLRETAVEDFLKNRRQWLSQENPRHCDWTSVLPSGAIPIDEYISHWEKLVIQDIGQLEWRIRADGPSWLISHVKKEAVLAKMDPTWIYLQCHNSQNPKGCYEQGLNELVREQERGPASQKEEWLSDYPFESLEERVNEDVGVKRQWFISHLEQEVTKAWSMCWRRGPNEMVLLATSPQWISSGFEYVDGKFAACLEDASAKLMDEIIQDNSPESLFWRNELKIPLKDLWKKKISAEAQIERSWLLKQSEVIKSLLSQDLLKQMKEQQVFNANAQCLNRLSYHYPTRMYFHERRQLNQHFGARICKEVLETELLKKSVTSYRKKNWLSFGNELTTQLLTRWEERSRRFCVGRIPAQEVRDLLETEKMKGCLREQFDLSWPEASTEVTQKFSLPEDSLHDLKAEVMTIAEASLLSQLKK